MYYVLPRMYYAFKWTEIIDILFNLKQDKISDLKDDMFREPYKCMFM